jgi:steroid delta-isomerase-like uncharacterized protein
MAVAAVFVPRSMTAFQYDMIIRRLEAAGAGTPPGRSHHHCFGTGDKLRVTEVWESRAAFERFQSILGPIIQQVGVDTPPPAIVPAHNVIVGVPTVDENVELVRDINNAFNERDLDRSLQYYASDIEWVDIPRQAVLRGPDVVRQWEEAWITAFDDGRVENLRIHGQGDVVTAEFNGRGTHTGPLVTPAGEIPATGRSVDLPFCQIFELRDGRVARCTNYYDSATMLSQLGIAGPLGRAPEKMPLGTTR